MEDPIVLQIFLMGFHHKQGWIKDVSYPQKSEIPAADLEHLPTLCLPDLSHNFDSDSVYFVLPSKNDSNDEKIFGVSCYRQISIEKLTNRSENDEFSRSSVQKAVCCLTRLPLWGYIEVKLNIIVDKIFENGNFDCDDLLEESYHELNRCLSLRIQRCYDDSDYISFNDDFINDFYIGTFLRELFTTWRHKVLVLFKLFLLEKRVLFFGSPVKPICTTILSILSLHPQLLNQGLCSYFNTTTNLAFHPQTTSDDSPQFNCQSQSRPDADKTPDAESIRSDDADSLKQITILPTIPPNEYLAPLQIYRNGSLCLPFISLQYIDTIMDKMLNGFIVGASNVLFMHKKNLFDVVIDVPNSLVDFVDPELKKCLSLSTEDLRFVEHVMKGIENPRADGYGTDCWIREQFESYFTAMLKTLYDVDSTQRDFECFNEHFMDMWKKTNNYQDWLAKKITSTTTSNRDEISAFDTFPKGHPFAKAGNAMNVSDVRNKIVQSFNNTQSARKINQAVNSTLTNAKSTFSSWLSNFSQKDEIAQDVVLDLKNQNDDEKSNNVQES